jgi:hypothetical protein
MAETLFGKLRRGLGALAEKANAIQPASGHDLLARRVAKHFALIAKVRSGVDGQIGQFVSAGALSSVLSTIASADIQAAWRQRGRTFPPRDDAGLFAQDMAWQTEQICRFGNVLAVLEPISYDWGYYGTKKSPDWLRHSVTAWLGRDGKMSIDLLAAMLAEAGLGITPALDILLCRGAGAYGTRNSVDRFSGVAEWLGGHAAEVVAALPELDADQRTEFAAAVGRLALTGRYLDTLVELAIGSSKKARTSARQALTGADPSALASRLQDLYPNLAPAARAEMIELAVVALGERAQELLSGWEAAETAPRVLVAIKRMSGSNAPGAEGGGEDETAKDGPDGYLGIDGVRIATPPLPAAPEASSIPDATMALLEPAAAAFTAKLAIAKREAAAQQQKWHWSRHFNPVGKAEIAQLRKQGEGDNPIAQQHNNVLGWLRSPESRHPGVTAFFDDSGLTLWHSVRFAAAAANGHFAAIFGDWAGPAANALARRIEQGADLRVVLTLWERFGGRDPIAEQMAAYWHRALSEQGTTVWTVLCGRFGLFDEAFGLVPQSGAKPYDVRVALDLLDRFPKVPRRYRRALMLLATGTSAQLRKPARALLRDAPGIDESIVDLLDDGRQEVRAGAAEWLQQRGAKGKIPELRKALAKERSEIARAAEITALDRLGDDVGDVFEGAAMIAEAEKGLAKTKAKELDWFPFDRMPALHWQDGKAVDVRLPRWWLVLAAKLKQPGGNALIDLWLDRLAPGDAHRLGWMVLTSWIEQDTRTCTVDEANAYAAAHVDATLQQHLNYIQRWPKSASYWSTDRDAIFAQLKNGKLKTYLGSAADSKGILALATRVNGADAAQKARPFLKDHGARTSQAKALLETLASNPSSAALQVVLSAANRSKQRSVQAHAGALIEAVAERHGWSAEELADRTIPTGGLDADGTLDLDCGRDRTYALRLDANDAVVLANPEGKEVKSLPTPRIDDEKPLIDAAKKLSTNARKEVKQVFAGQTERLREAMALGRHWPREDWESFIAGHPLVGRLAQRLIWLGLDADATATAFRPLGDGSFTDAADEDVDVSAFAKVQLAHRSLLLPDAIEAWRKHLADYEIQPPFDQIGRDLPSLTASMATHRDIRDREGWIIETFQLRGIANKLGYVRGAAGDGGWFTTYERPYRGAGMVAEIEFSGSPLPEENAPAVLHALSFRLLRENGYHGRQLALKEVPPVLLAETWQDLHDIAAKGSGFDPEWQKKVP